VSYDGKTLVELIDVERVYGQGSHKVHAVNKVSLTIPQGEMVSLMGRSGSGKTTLLNIMGGLDMPTRGQVLYKGKSIHSMSAKELLKWRRKEIGFAFQAFALIPSLTAVENVEIGLQIAGVPTRERRKIAKSWLDRVGLGKRLNQGTLQLSGGEQQRVAIARAFAHQPQLVLADEPTGALDVATGMSILHLFQEIIKENKTTICIATHDPKVAQFATVTFYLKDGMLSVQETLTPQSASGSN
jgi:putative ABC transport system ATP-binding protein